MTRKQRRTVMVSLGLSVLAFATTLVILWFTLTPWRNAVAFFRSPSDIVDGRVTPGARVRLGGLVKPGSIARGENLNVSFVVTDGKGDVAVTYRGSLPDLFREGQGVVVDGAVDATATGLFRADTVLAKHDES